MSVVWPANTQVDVSRCSCLQEEELQVLESIYPDYLSNNDQFSTDRTIRFEIPVELSGRHVVLLPEQHDYHSKDIPSTDSLAGSDSSGITDNIATLSVSAQVEDYTQRTVLPLSTLPPLLLTLTIPAEYPIHKPPIIISLHASYAWVPEVQLKLLERNLLSIWEEEQKAQGEGRGVLYDWIEMIRSAEFLDPLGFLDSDTVRIPHAAPALLGSQLTNFDKNIRLMRFSENAYTCEICLTSIKGAKCILLRCEHVFCRACLMEFWQLCISEGDVDRVGCPDIKCVKDGNLAEEEDVRRVVATEEEVKRWKWLKEKKEIEKDPTITHCLMPFCQAPVKKPDAEDGSGWERLRSCSACGYSFCVYCKRTWHGPHTNCLLSATEGFMMEYMASTEGSARQRELEIRYGRNNMQRLVKQYKEERANKEWLENSTTECPGCRVYVEKSMGCNHMTCAKCKIHFCYRCGERLLAVDPYMHFSRKGHPCYSKLFDFESVEDDNEWQPIEALDF